MERSSTLGTPLKVVCDAGPLIHLDELDILFLLTDFEEVLVPRAVWTEVARHRKAAARLVADRMGFRVHGTIGLIVRAIRRNQLSPEKVVEILSAIPEKSTLYIKADLLNDVITRIKKKFGI